MNDNDQWLEQFRAGLVDHLERHSETTAGVIRQLPAGSDEACRTAGDLAQTEQSLETLKRRMRDGE